MTVNYKSFAPPPFCKKEILRYAGAAGSDYATSVLLDEVIAEAESAFCYKVCYAELPLKITEDVCDFDVFSVKSKDLAKNLKECDGVILFAATVGVGIDRLISKYSRLSPSRAVMLDAVGSERIESLCDTFCAELSGLHNAVLAPRFSPGYGDLPLDTQRSIAAVLNMPKNIGVSLTDSLMLTPAKSVTAFAGIKKG